MDPTRYDGGHKAIAQGELELPRPWIKKYEFNVEVLDIIVGGTSAIDAGFGFSIQSHEQAEKYLRGYGFNFENPIEQAELSGHYHEALNFIRKNFLQPDNPEGLKLDVPRRLLELTDVRDLFLMASHAFPGQTSDTSGHQLRQWACSILKVMHTIAHIDQDIRTSTFSDVQKQIFDRFYKHIHRDSDDKLFLGEKAEDPFKVHLVAFETKPKKSRDSILVKLLHKPENVAEDIFDRVGVRFITQSKIDALRVVKYLKEHRIIMPPNIKPSRSRNTLINVQELKAKSAEMIANIESSDMDETTFVQTLEATAGETSKDGKNAHTSEFYRAIQFTCRQLIKLKSPLYDQIKEAKAFSKDKTLPEDLIKALERIEIKYLPREVRFFYPFEIQVVDRQSAIENEKGKSAHSEYKKSQIQTAMTRVMGSLASGPGGVNPV